MNTKPTWTSWTDSSVNYSYQLMQNLKTTVWEAESTLSNQVPYCIHKPPKPPYREVPASGRQMPPHLSSMAWHVVVFCPRFSVQSKQLSHRPERDASCSRVPHNQRHLYFTIGRRHWWNDLRFKYLEIKKNANFIHDHLINNSLQTRAMNLKQIKLNYYIKSVTDHHDVLPCPRHHW